VTEKVKGTQCTAKSRRSGERCKRVVLGGGVCRMHGGAAPAVRAKQLQRLAVQQAALDVRSVNPSLAPASPGQVMLEQMQSARERVAGLEGLVWQQQSAPGLSLQGTTEWLFRERELLQKLASDCLRLKAEAVVEAATQDEITRMDAILAEFCRQLGLDLRSEVVSQAAMDACDVLAKSEAFQW